jgi:hypothetical protein
MDTENTDLKTLKTESNIKPEVTESKQEPINAPVTVAPVEKVKKPRKPLSEESKKKRADVLVRARQAKLDKLKQTTTTKKQEDIKPLVEPIINQILETKKAQKPPKVQPEAVAKKPKKSEDEKIMKKVQKKLQIEAVVEERLSEFKDELKQKKERNKTFSIKNLF